MLLSSNREIVTKFLISNDMTTTLPIDLNGQLRSLNDCIDLSNLIIKCDICHASFIGENKHKNMHLKQNIFNSLNTIVR